ncbi:sugar transferase, partial [Phenylobacterium sp.]|uniref:sugar transferase n=1 Tax=Phenylobacterium sp. TaxID=1871053 RepID=UPI0032C2374F
MLAEEGRADRVRASRAEPRPVPVPPEAWALPVATHPFKRLLDVLIAGFALLLFLPLLAVVSGVIRLESPGPAIFRQRR